MNSIKVDERFQLYQLCQSGQLSMWAIAIRAFRVIGIDKIEAMTFDNGKEFGGHEELARTLSASCCFANPYCSWERGLNEHTNGLVRRFFPKGTDFREVRQKDRDEAVKLINHRPRKALGYRTPHEVFWGHSGVVHFRFEFGLDRR
jgi:transposase, IS30 family